MAASMTVRLSRWHLTAEKAQLTACDHPASCERAASSLSRSYMACANAVFSPRLSTQELDTDGMHSPGTQERSRDATHARCQRCCKMRCCVHIVHAAAAVRIDGTTQRSSGSPLAGADGGSSVPLTDALHDAAVPDKYQSHVSSGHRCTSPAAIE